jgi:hypothetical protein
VHHLLLQRSDGVFQWVVWGEQVSASNSITINFDSSRATIKIYDVTVGEEPIQTLTNVTSIPLKITDHAMIVEVH